MGQANRRSLARFGSFVIVLGAHLLLIVILSTARLVETRRVTADSQEPLLWIPLSPDVPRKETEKKEDLARPERSQISQDVSSSERDANVTSVRPTDPLEPGAVDWNAEAEAIAKSMAPGLIKELQRKCEEAEQRSEAPPPGCKRRVDAKEWEPEPKRTGFVGVLPYVRVGRCLVGLGFFGCEIEKDAPDGTVLDDMHNPDRPMSSVPDLQEPDSAFAQRPVPQAFKDSGQP